MKYNYSRLWRWKCSLFWEAMIYISNFSQQYNIWNSKHKKISQIFLCSVLYLYDFVIQHESPVENTWLRLVQSTQRYLCFQSPFWVQLWSVVYSAGQKTLFMLKNNGLKGLPLDSHSVICFKWSGTSFSTLSELAFVCESPLKDWDISCPTKC